MSRIFVHSDWHFRHDFVARTRGFESAEDHDAALLDSINSTVTKRDHIWVLGDVFMGSATAGLEAIARVNGIKHLVLGNHDAAHPLHKKSHTHVRRFLEVFDSVHLHEELRLPGGRRVLLSHFPYSGDHSAEERYAQWRLRDEGAWLLHGHVHDAWTFRGRQINVGVDRWRAPVPADHLANLINEWEGLQRERQ